MSDFLYFLGPAIVIGIISISVAYIGILYSLGVRKGLASRALFLGVVQCLIQVFIVVLTEVILDIYDDEGFSVISVFAQMSIMACVLKYFLVVNYWRAFMNAFLAGVFGGIVVGLTLNA
ncbi:MAG: hypothetical protein CL693_08975 [Cellvibrionaceae bacterium]|nr:hypothetical protein [Cellvibrionaceae bacterium]|tara:strand:+ start:61 stop:417 length:357 start_codon:yes stop_codon:yes gene_type:complete